MSIYWPRRLTFLDDDHCDRKLHVSRANPYPKHLPHPVSREFLDTYEWAELRYDALKKYGGTCKACGIRAGMIGDDGRPAVINVDHIKNRRDWPHLALELSNTQPLCHLCNKGKSNRDSTDWR